MKSKAVSSTILTASILWLLTGGLAAALDVGFTSSQNKIFFEPPSEFAGRLVDTGYIALARNEYEAVQMVLFPVSDLPGITVEATALTATDGPGALALDAIEVKVVGYVNLLAAKVPGDRIGWHPDPLLPNQPVDLQANTPQPYLVTVYAHDTVQAGTYEGNILIRQNGLVLRTLWLRVTVWDFALPHVPTFKTTSLTFRSAPDDMWPGRVRSEAHRDTLLFRLADLGFKNRIPPTGALANGLYSWTWNDGGYTNYGYPTHDGDAFNAARTDRFVDYMLQKGANVFIIGYTFDIYHACCDTAQRAAALRKYLTDMRAYLAGRNLLDRAMLYNIDEPWGEAVTHAQAIYTMVKRDVGPDIRIMQNTNQNNASIVGTLLGYFDVLNINLGHYYINDIDGYRTAHPAELAETWWNVNIWPDTHPNLFLEYPLVDARIFGPLSYKFDIQGFEYWNLKSQWSIGNYYPIAPDDLRVQWDVSNRSLDGSLVYPGDNFEIYSSLRFESFRDGMEDYEYLRILEQRDSTHPLLSVDLVYGLSSFTQDPLEILQFREDVARAISGVPTDLDDGEPARPRRFALNGNYPNPFNAGTRIQFVLDRPARISVDVFNPLGQHVARLHGGQRPAGPGEVDWDGRDGNGSDVPSGVYFYRLSVDKQAEAGKMLLLR